MRIKNLTYGPRDVDNVSWAFCLVPVLFAILLLLLLLLIAVAAVAATLSRPCFSHPVSTPRAVARSGGRGCWSSWVSFPSLSSLSLLTPAPGRRNCSTHHLPHEQLLVRLGQVVCHPHHLWSVLIPVVALSSSPIRRSWLVVPRSS
jgi:hypothetical protein